MLDAWRARRPQFDKKMRAVGRCSKDIGSVVGTLAVTTGIAHAEEPPKTTGKAIETSQKRLPATLKKRTKKVVTKKNPALKRDRVRKT
jgi:hypothetical protein